MKGFVIALLALAACNGDIDASSIDAAPGGGGSGTTYMDAPAGSGEPANMTGTTDAHNAIRAAVDTTGIAAGPLPTMKWDPALATLATNWASQCIDTDNNGLVDHSSSQSRNNAAGYAYVGENIYASGGTATGPQAVMYWAMEKANFTYPNTSAATGHYTQIVWRTSVNVGCALVSCPSLQYKSVVLCNYGPGGNSGGAPY
jgi:pathogenesis-related protein 1